MTSTPLAELSARLRQIERARVRPARDLSPASCGRGGEGSGPAEGLQQLLPEGLSLRGGLVEWLSDRKGSGCLSVAVLASQPAVGDGLWVFVDHQHQYHAPGLAALSLDLRRVVFVRPRRQTDVLWAAEQALRTRGVGAVVCEFDRLSTAAFRRLQLAAETGGTLGILLRPERVRHQPSWAEHRLLVSPLATATNPGTEFVANMARECSLCDTLPPRQPPARLGPRQMQVELLWSRKKFADTKSVIVELDDADDRVYLASRLAPATTAVRATGA